MRFGFNALANGRDEFDLDMDSRKEHKNKKINYFDPVRYKI